MTEGRMFPILSNCRTPRLQEVPWSFVERGRKQAENNHYQTLERLAERGGLSPAELAAALLGVDPRRINPDKAKVEAWLLQELAKHAK
jgi:pyrroloquinoline quinone (PQQ) biosynthesis protein C